MPEKTEYEEKVLSLLRYALAQRRVPEHLYFIGEEGDERGQHDKLCLLKQDDGWAVLYTERGTVRSKSTHSNVRDAATDLFWKLTRRDTPWDFKLQWESETGQSF